ncbi:hypothetical protein EYC84_008090 [Monilinia fructicola]|uniref:Uncharacterized protein n=1 Tax=Monilinia fructicola TaxID=38448 RepID=A0A5M9JKP3_MONFR|nr:hypothetical protein EYC84_008090 [Monilinia fructicola]
MSLHDSSQEQVRNDTGEADHVWEYNNEKCISWLSTLSKSTPKDLIPNESVQEFEVWDILDEYSSEASACPWTIASENWLKELDLLLGMGNAKVEKSQISNDKVVPGSKNLTGPFQHDVESSQVYEDTKTAGTSYTKTMSGDSSSNYSMTAQSPTEEKKEGRKRKWAEAFGQPENP